MLRKIEALAVDSGYRPTQVLEWCRRRPNAYAIKGMPGRGVAAISPPVRKSVNKRGKRKRHGSAMSWPVGTWALKAEFYGNLHKTGLRSGEATDPPGYCHFHMDLGEEYFQQLTAEYFSQKMVKGKLHEEWMPRREHNHFLDCRIYAMAMAEHLGISRLTKSQWAALRAKHEPATPVDLLSPESQQVAERVSPEEAPAALPPQVKKPVENRWAKRR